VESASGFAQVKRNGRSVVVDPGVDVDFGTVIAVTPFVNLRDVSYWVQRDLDADTFTIRLSAPLRRAVPFGWLIVESGLAAPEASAAPGASASPAADEG